MSQSRILAAYLGDIRFEVVKMLRTPAFAVPTLMFPLMFYMLFGVFMGSMRGNAEMAQYTFATYGVFGAMAPGLFGFGVSLAFDREQGLLTFRQAIPMPAGSYLLARMAMAMLFVAVSSLLLMALAIFVAHVPLTFTQGVTVFLRQRARRAAVLRHGPVRGLAGVRPGRPGHRESHLPADGIPVGTVGTAAVPRQDHS